MMGRKSSIKMSHPSTRKSSIKIGRVSRKSLVFNNSDPELGINEKRLTRVTSKAIHRFDRRGFSKFSKLASGMASKVLSAYLGFKDPRKRRREYLIPKDKSAWLEWLVYVAKRHVHVEYLTDKELRKVIIRARPNLSMHKKNQEPIEDHDLPSCIEWTEKQVGDWIASIGWPQLRETFVRNMITGRRLVLIDCTALNKMGMTDLASMREVAGKIRELLGTPPPNALRPIMRIPPYERFLRRKVYNGKTYDEMTFEKFCELEGYNYDIIQYNLNAQIPCTCEVLITTPDQADGEGSEDEEEISLNNAPTVEYLVRNALVRNKTIDQIMKDILENVFLPPRERKYGKEVWGTLKRGIGEGYDDLHLYYPKDKLDFASGVAHHLIDELYKTVAILNDISQLERHVKEDITPEDMQMFQDAATILVDEAAPIAALLALGELDLETMFRKEPTFEKYVDEVIHEAEKRTNALVPDASAFVDEVIQEAWRKIPELDLEGLSPELKRSILRMANEVLYGIIEDRDDIVETVMSAATADISGAKSRAELGSPSTAKPGMAKGKDVRADKSKQQTTQQQQLKRKMSHAATGSPSTTATKPSGSPSSKAPAPEGGGDKTEKTPPPTEHSATTEGNADGQEGGKTDAPTKPPSGPGESGSENKEADHEKDKGKGKKQDKHDKDKPKHDEDKPGGGGGEGDLAASQSLVVHTAAVELVPPPPTPTLGKLSERRDSPQLRSQMTLATPTSAEYDMPIPRTPMTLGSADRRSAKRGSSDSDVTAAETLLQRKLSTPIVTLPAQKKLTAYRPTPQPKPQPKVLRMSKDQDRILKPLLEAANAEKNDDKKIPEAYPPPIDVSPRQGHKQPPPQAVYTTQQGLLRTQKELTLQTKGEKPRIAYHQRKGIMDPTNRRFGSIEKEHHDEPEPPQGSKVEHEPLPGQLVQQPKASKWPKVRSNFVMIPKALKQMQIDMAKVHGQTLIVPVPEQIVPQTPPPPGPDPKEISKAIHETVLELEKETVQSEKRISAMSESAALIWEQMKEQFEAGKAAAKEGQRKFSAKDKKHASMDKGSEKQAGKPAEENKPQEKQETTEKKRTLTQGPLDVIVDPRHLQEMKEHREVFVEDWAKKHSLDPTNPKANKQEWSRQVRMTADKVVTEICTMALTHMLLQAEAGKDTQRILSALKQLEPESQASVTGHQEVTLWKTGVDPARLGHSKQAFQPRPGPIIQIPTDGLDTTTLKTPPPASKSRGSGQSEGKKSDGTTSQKRPSGGQKQSTDGQKRPSVEQKLEEKPIRSILHVPGADSDKASVDGANKLKAQAKSVVVNAVKSAYEDSGAKKPLTRSTPKIPTTSVRKDQFPSQ